MMHNFSVHGPIRQYILGLALLAALAGAWLTIALTTRPQPEQSSSSSAQVGGPFTLIDTTGKTITDRQMAADLFRLHELPRRVSNGTQ